MKCVCLTIIMGIGLIMGFGLVRSSTQYCPYESHHGCLDLLHTLSHPHPHTCIYLSLSGIPLTPAASRDPSETCINGGRNRSQHRGGTQPKGSRSATTAKRHTPYRTLSTAWELLGRALRWTSLGTDLKTHNNAKLAT
jgi:hypothetical protein